MITIIITGARQVPIANVIITSGPSCPDSTTVAPPRPPVYVF